SACKSWGSETTQAPIDSLTGTANETAVLPSALSGCPWAPTQFPGNRYRTLASHHPDRRTAGARIHGRRQDGVSVEGMCKPWVGPKCRKRGENSDAADVAALLAFAGGIDRARDRRRNTPASDPSIRQRSGRLVRAATGNADRCGP